VNELVSHFGVAAGQSESAAQSTQVPVLVSHASVDPVQALRLVPEHIWQCPLTQAGFD
jgi:hypothetical protein